MTVVFACAYCRHSSGGLVSEAARDTEGLGGGGDPSGNANAELTARLWAELLEIDARLSEKKKVRLLTVEARVLINLMIKGPMSVTAAMQLCGGSYRGFYD